MATIQKNVTEHSRQNHYVPKWYQKGFLVDDSRGTVHYLDLERLNLRLRPSKNCFVKEDLYTTRLGQLQLVNDEVERFFFGPIDSNGARAVRALIANDPQAIRQHFRSLMEYLSVQKLRTPTGLDWICTNYPKLSQVDLMAEMQNLSNMHCAMWSECVREIVSAKNSDVKFIVTDHPVTTYNPACSPNSSRCKYPGDPPISLNGTQTVFALDADHCLILTNLDYAKNPADVELLSPRVNARHFGSSLVKTTAMVRTRLLNRDEVRSINYLLKSRARRFIAGYDREWLFPEVVSSVSWESIGKLLLPPTDQLSEFGREVFIPRRDGTVFYRDPYGRSESSHEILQKKHQPSPSINDRCGCGSGKKYKRCCFGVAEGDRPPWNVYSIRQRNLIFYNGVVDILDLDKGKNWTDIRMYFSNEQVKRIHRLQESLWPTDTNLAALLPRPEKRVFRAVHMGFVDPRTIGEAVIAPLAYFDEIFVLNPFTTPRHMASNSPTQSPELYKPQLLKNLSVFFTLKPFIDAGIVHFIPDPMEFNPNLTKVLLTMGEQRENTWNCTDEELQPRIELAKDDCQRNILRFSDDVLRTLIRQDTPDVDDNELHTAVQELRYKLLLDPLALLQYIPEGAEDSEIHWYNYLNLELALFVAHLTGAAIYTDLQLFWRQLHELTSAARCGSVPRFRSFADNMARHQFPIDLNPQFNFKIREANKLLRMRRFFRSCWNAALTDGNLESEESNTKELATRLTRIAKRSESEWCCPDSTSEVTPRKRLSFELAAPTEGFDMLGVHRLISISGRETYLRRIPLALRLSFVEDPATR